MWLCASFVCAVSAYLFKTATTRHPTATTSTPAHKEENLLTCLPLSHIFLFICLLLLFIIIHTFIGRIIYVNKFCKYYLFYRLPINPHRSTMTLYAVHLPTTEGPYSHIRKGDGGPGIAYSGHKNTFILINTRVVMLLTSSVTVASHDSNVAGRVSRYAALNYDILWAITNVKIPGTLEPTGICSNDDRGYDCRSMEIVGCNLCERCCPPMPTQAWVSPAEWLPTSANITALDPLQQIHWVFEGHKRISFLTTS